MSEENYLSNNQIKKRAAKKHNEERAKRLALEKDKQENPEKYRRHRRIVKSSAIPLKAMAIALCPRGL